MGHATHAVVFHHMVIVNLLSWALLLIGGPLEKSSIFFLPQTSCLVLDHVYACYMTSHVKFC